MPTTSTSTSNFVLGHQFSRLSPPLYSAASSGEQDKDGKNLLLLDTIRSMRVKELKAELAERRISTADVFEKEELVQRLYNAKLKSQATATATASPAKRTTSAPSSPSSDGVLRADLFFTSVESGRSMAGIYDNSESVTIKVEGGSDPYPTIAIDVDDEKGESTFPLKLLVDTACSGLVLRPSVVQKHSSCLKSYSTPVTMTGGGGAAAATGLTQIESYSLADTSATVGTKKRLGPLPAAVQDIGALPMALDGILGLSLLSQYACTEFDLDNSRLNLYQTEYRPPLEHKQEDEVVVAEAEMSPTKLGIWTVDVSFSVGGRTGNPVKMLVDTGAMATFLTWKGLEDTGLGLSRSSPIVKELTQPMGAMGSDNVAMSLTHRIELDVDAPIVFGKNNRQQRNTNTNTSQGLSIVNKNGGSKPLPIDIGNIGILENQLASDKVVGILGMDIFSKASRIRMTFRGPVPRITFYQTTSKPKPKTNDNNTNTTTNKRGARSNDAVDTEQERSYDAKTKTKSAPMNPVAAATTASSAPKVDESKSGNSDPLTTASAKASSAETHTTNATEQQQQQQQLQSLPLKKKKKKKRRYE